MGQTKNFPYLLKYLHTASFSPVPSTWIAAIRRVYFQSWTGLAEEAAHKQLPKSKVTEMGNLDQTSKNKRSTQPTPGVFQKKCDNLLIETDIFCHFRGLIFSNAKCLQFHRNKKQEHRVTLYQVFHTPMS